MKRVCLMKKIMTMIAALVVPASLFAYSPAELKSTEEEYFDFLALNGITERPSLNYRTLSDSRWIFLEDEHIWQNNCLGSEFEVLNMDFIPENFFTQGLNRSIVLNFYGPYLFNSFNSNCPYGQNDGILWQGRGYNASFSAGARLEGLGFELTLKPVVSFSQNLDFEVFKPLAINPYSYFVSGIDLVQRFGDKSFFSFDWGDSEIRYTWNTLTVGFGTQNPWLGPAWLNPMLGSNNAGSYPKFDMGMRRQKILLPFVDYDLGDIEGRLWVGYLSESDYFDGDDTNNHNLIAGFSAAYSPSFIPGFTIGANKVSLTKWGMDFYRFLYPFYSRNGEAEGLVDDQKMSIFADWMLPAAGFEMYVEFGKDDYSAFKIENPFHTGIYTVGFKQFFDLDFLPDLGFELVGEYNNFEMSQDFQAQWQYIGYYGHYTVTQGYTNKGQILGAGSGYFGNSQYIGLRTYFPRGNVCVYLHRSCPDNNYLYNKSVYTSSKGEAADWWSRFKTYFVPGLEGSFYLTDNLLLRGNFGYCQVYLPLYDEGENFALNCHAEFSIKYSF